ncbi:MAG: restriction endonuclease [Phycisphaerae bacterium]|nr:restriction endonuclease [Phycisphaerae bacterium]
MLRIDSLCANAAAFAQQTSCRDIPELYGVDNGKSVGSWVEIQFQAMLAVGYDFPKSNAAAGIDCPSLNVDVKATSITQPQSSCPFKSAAQKIFGLGYALLVFVYEKADNASAKTSRLDFHHIVFVDASCTADFQTSRGIRQILENGGNEDDLIAFMSDKNLPVDSIEAKRLAAKILKSPPKQGYLTISNALQWRLQYTRVIGEAGKTTGIVRVR